MRHILVSIALLLIVLAACGPQATPEPTLAPSPEPTAAPSVAGMPEGVTGDPVNGEILFKKMIPQVNFACSTCHHVDRADRLIGPGLVNIVADAAEYAPDQTAYEYLHAAIVDPSAFVVPDYPDNLMPKTYAEVFTEQEVNDLVAYMLTLGGEG
jgi:cytochrome c2